MTRALVGPSQGRGAPRGSSRVGPHLRLPQQTGSLWTSWKNRPHPAGAMCPLGPSELQPHPLLAAEDGGRPSIWGSYTRCPSLFLTPAFLGETIPLSVRAPDFQEKQSP